MLAVAGRLASGTVTWLTGPKTIRDHIRPTISDAAERAGRSEPRIVASLIVTVTDDEDGVRAGHATNLSGYGSLPSYRSMLEREGAETPADWWLPQPDFAAVEVGTNPEEKQRTRALLKKAAASGRKMQ